MVLRRSKAWAGLFLRHGVPLLAWAAVMQLLFEGPWIPHTFTTYKSLCYLLIVFGGSIVATDGKRILQYAVQYQTQTATATDAILTLRGVGTTILILLEIATTLWDLHAGKTGAHFPLAWRAIALFISLPTFFYTSGVLLRRQDQVILARKLQAPQ